MNKNFEHEQDYVSLRRKKSILLQRRLSLLRAAITNNIYPTSNEGEKGVARNAFVCLESMCSLDFFPISLSLFTELSFDYNSHTNIN